VLLLPLSALAQLQLYVAPPGATETAFPGVYDMGTVAVADSLDARFRIRNTGPTTVTLTYLYCAGAGFTMTGAPSMPFVVAPGVNVDFTIRFAPGNSGVYSANLQINGTGYLLRGTALAGVTLRQGSEDVATGASLDLGRVERGESAKLDLTLLNTTSESVALDTVSLSGSGFSMDLTGPLVIPPATAVPFRVTWRPAVSGISTGTLTLDRRTFRVTGTSYEPTLPRPFIVIESPAIRSGQQGRVSVHLASVSKAYATGQLRMELRPNGTVRDNDAAAMFTAGSRTIPFNVSPGDDMVKLRGDTSAVFQSGTTAGTIVFVVEAGGYTDQGFVIVEPEAVRVDKSTATRNSGGVDVTLAGFDNTRTLKEIAFTFYSNGQPLAGMPIRSAVLTDFSQWWTSSTLGGIFQLRAAFPITGDASKVTGVEMTLTNSTGETRTERLSF
jgi:hypothetical protein